VAAYQKRSPHSSGLKSISRINRGNKENKMTEISIQNNSGGASIIEVGNITIGGLFRHKGKIYERSSDVEGFDGVRCEEVLGKKPREIRLERGTIVTIIKKLELVYYL